MIDHFTIFSKGGIVLWSFTQAKLKGSPVDRLIRSVLLEERTGENQYHHDTYTLKWTFANEFDLVFVVVYQKILSLLYIDDLLDIVSKKFCEEYKEELKNLKQSLKDQSRFLQFTDMFTKILNALESRNDKMKTERQKGPRSFEQTNKGKALIKDRTEKGITKKIQPKGPTKVKNPKNDEDDDEDEEEDVDENNDDVENDESDESTDKNSNNVNTTNETPEEEETRKIRENIEKMKLRKSGNVKKPVKTTAAPSPPKKRGDRTWDDKVTDKEMKSLDRSSGSIEQIKVGSVEVKKQDWDKFNDDDDEDILTSPKNEKSKGGFMSFLQGLSGNKPLEASDLVPVLSQFKDHLISKNVASEIAEKLCESVSKSLEGKKLGTLTGVKSTVRTALEDALKRILTPKRNIDILSDALQAKKEKRPYTIVFVGVNGVGKSTNLSKVCYFFKSEGLKVLIAACDTFRSGAVEQLAVHAKRLDVELFERGYRNDASVIAMDAIRQAKQQGKDVVLIDTAGRMQDNEPLMIALSKLVNNTKPDLVLFVGEALVGNDAVDQLTKFNKALVDLSKDKEPRLIDGIILSKFDTIDDKVGAAISMVYTTGSPIVFLGVGQHYTDIRRLNVGVVTKALLKGS